MHSKLALTLWFMISVSAMSTIAGDSELELAVTNSKVDCTPIYSKGMLARLQKEGLNCFDLQGSALIGKRDNRFSLKIIRDSSGKLIALLSQTDADGNLSIKDAVMFPKLGPNDTVLYGNCYTNPDSMVIDALAIASYSAKQQFLKPKQSWLIDFTKAKFLPNKGIKITCINESYGT